MCNHSAEEVVHLTENIKHLTKKLNDAKYLLCQVADEAQFNGGFSDPVYLMCKKALEDKTKWEL